MMAVLGALWASGCDPAGPAEPSSPAIDRAAAVQPPPPARRGRLIAGERVQRIPQWPSPAEIDEVAAARLSEAARGPAARSPVPVLIPGEAGLAAEAAIFSEAWGYALSAREGTRTVALQASRSATLLPHVRPVPGKTKLRGTLGWVSSNDGIRTASWIEHETAYSLDLECYSPDGPECSEQALLAAVEGLVYVGGQGAVQPRGGDR